MTPQTDHDDADGGGTYEPGENGEEQADLTADDPASEGPEEDHTSDLPDAETKYLGDFA